MSRNNGSSTGRDAAWRFTVGNPGLAERSEHRATVAAEALLDGEAERLQWRQSLGGA